MHRLLVFLWGAILLSAPGLAAQSDWPMLAHDAQRSGGTAVDVRPPFARKWFRMFANEGLMSGIQPVVADGRVFIGTLHGVFHALSAETGLDLWSYRCPAAILHAAAFADGLVVFGCADGGIYALHAADGKLAWEVRTGSAVWNAPAISEGVVYVGSRDHRLYAIETSTGNVRWTGDTEGPILGSPAIDPQRKRAYIGSEDMSVYAFDLSNGNLAWRSSRLPGVSLRGYHPVVAPDGSVLVTAAPGLSVDTFQDLLLKMAKEIFGDFASWRHSKEANAILRDENFALMQKPETYSAQLNYLRQRLTEEPAFQTFFVLDPVTGRQKFVTPIVYSESMNGPGAPAVVAADGKVLVKFQALLRSRYEHYSPFLNVGQLDTTTGELRPVMDQSRTYGWYDSLLLVHDEQSQLSLAGQVLVNAHQDSVNGLDLASLEGFTAPFCRNIHEPKPGEALAIWLNLLRQQPLPNGKEWLARGTAVYGGGSVLDTSVVFAGDTFYYIPTHELSAGAALIAYRSQSGGDASNETTLPAPTVSTNEWKSIQELPWDWDSLENRRLMPTLEALPGKIPGTRQAPLTNAAVEAVGKISDAAWDPILWEARQRRPQTPSTTYVAGMAHDLAVGIRELISQPWQPLVFPSGKFPEESYRFFTEPTETLYTLALAFPLLDAETRREVINFVDAQGKPGGPLTSGVGDRTYTIAKGATRSAYTVPPERLLKFQPDILRSPVARLYPVWLWAYRSGDWTKLEKDWSQLSGLIDQRPNPFEEDCRNGYIAGLIAYCRIADHLHDTKARDAGVTAARQAIRERLLFEIAHPRGGLIWPVPKLRSIFARWRFLTPEVGRLLGQYAEGVQAGLMERYVDYHRPTWWLAWNVETVVRNECPYEFPTLSAEVFSARSLVLNEGADKLALYIDRPWCHADEYYLQKLALTIEAGTPSDWVDVRTNAPPAR